MGQFHFDPERYLADVRTEVPGYRLQDEVGDWLREAGFATARTTWAYRDLAVLVADVA
jgi:hypothetical protein